MAASPEAAKASEAMQTTTVGVPSRHATCGSTIEVVTRRIGAALVAALLLGAAGGTASAASPSAAGKLRRAEAQLRQLDRQSNTAPPATPTELRAAIAQWRAAATGYGRLGVTAATGEHASPSGSRRMRAAWAALRDLAGWRVRQLTYSADLFSGFLQGGVMSDGAKEGLARMSAVELDLRAKLRTALARVAA